MEKTHKLPALQKKILEVFTLIDEICEENNLKYFAIGGTTLGAARHKGFIPWDDDLDIAMPFDDIQKLVSIIDHQYSGKIGIHKLESNAFIYKIFDKSTTQVSEGEFNPKNYTGVFVDIMPLFSIPNKSVARWFFWKKIRYLMRINNIIEKPADRNGMKRVVYWFTRVLSKDFFIESYRAELNKRNFYDTKFTHTARTWGAGRNRSKKAFMPYEKTMFGDGMRLKFEGVEIRCPADYKTYLKITFGDDYMTLPPESQRIPAHTRILDLEHSYRYYIAKERGDVVGYTAGCYDMFHVGHLNLIKRAKENCDYLLVGVNADEAMYSYKKKYPVIPETERKAVIEALRYADEVVIVSDTDKLHAHDKHGYDVIFVGDDHKGEPTWLKLEDELLARGSKVHYFEYTGHTSSTKLRSALDDIIKEKKSTAGSK